MESSTVLSDPALFAELQGLELKARLLVEGYLSGLHRSPYRGFSVEFAEHREYVPGDDLRYVDWKVFGKTDRFYLKQFHEETNFTCTLLVDVSESMSYRSERAAASKLAYAQWTAAALAYLVIRQRDAVGVATFDESIRQFVRPGSTAGQWRDVCRVLESAAARGRSAVGQTLHELAERLLRRGIVVVVSDFFDEFAALARGLRHLRFRRHDVLLLQILDPAELEFPFDVPTLFRGLEQWSDLLTDPRGVRRRYLAELNHHLGQLKGLAHELGFDYARFRTDQPLAPALAAVLAQRWRRQAL
jgi:uncharacterized protein (DUF58 family)